MMRCQILQNRRMTSSVCESISSNRDLSLRIVKTKLIDTDICLSDRLAEVSLWNQFDFREHCTKLVACPRNNFEVPGRQWRRVRPPRKSNEIPRREMPAKQRVFLAMRPDTEPPDLRRVMGLAHNERICCSNRLKTRCLPISGPLISNAGFKTWRCD